jgi:hypothetical protein
MPDVRVDPRGVARIPVTASINENIQYKGLRPFEGKMQVYQRHFFADSISVPGGSGEVVSQTVDGDVRTITFLISSSYSRENIIAYVIGRAGIAEFDSSYVTFDTTAAAFGAVVTTDYKKGLLRIANPNPDRHTLVTKGPVIRSISPVPASSDVSVSIVSSQASPATMRIIDAQGSIVQSSQHQIPVGMSELDIDIRSLVRGVYTVMLVSADAFTSQPLVIVRP